MIGEVGAAEPQAQIAGRRRAVAVPRRTGRTGRRRRATRPCRNRAHRRSSAPRRRPNRARRPPTRIRSARQRRCGGPAPAAPRRRPRSTGTEPVVVGRSTSMSFDSADQRHRDAGVALVGDQQVRPAPDHQHGQRRSPARRRPPQPGRRWCRVARTPPRRRRPVRGHRPQRHVALGQRAQHPNRQIDALGQRSRRRPPASRSSTLHSRVPDVERSPRQATRRCRRSPSRCRRRRRAARRRRTRSGRCAAAATRPACRGCASSTALTTSLPVTPGMGTVPLA